MKSSQLRFGVFLVVGTMLLFLPLSIFHFHAGPVGKLVALRYLAVSLVGLSLIALALATEYFARRARNRGDQA